MKEHQSRSDEREAEFAAMREALEAVLASAVPNERDNPTMFAAWKKARAALSSTAGAELLDRLRKVEGERDAAIREREACHEIYDRILALCGYAKGQGYPGLQGAVEKAISERDTALAQVEAMTAIGERLAGALRAVRADRPSVHTDDVWLELNSALAEWEARKPAADGKTV